MIDQKAVEVTLANTMKFIPNNMVTGACKDDDYAALVLTPEEYRKVTTDGNSTLSFTLNQAD